MSNMIFLVISYSIIIALVTVIACLVGYIIYSLAFSNRFKFIPISEKIERHRLSIPIESRDQILTGYLFKLKKLKSPAPVSLLMHGYGNDTCGEFAYLINTLVLQGYVVFGYDQYGHGASRVKGGRNLKDPDKFFKMFADFNEIMTFLQTLDSVDAERISIVGQSMGGNFALSHAIKHPKIKLVIALAAMHDLNKALRTMNRMWRWIYRYLLHLYKGKGFTEAENATFSPVYQFKGKTIEKPVFLAHCKDDPIARVHNYYENVELFKLKPENCLLFLKGGHRFRNHETVLCSQIISWLNSSL